MAQNSIARVVLWMTGALLSFSAMAVSVRLLAGKLNIFEILTIRSIAGLVIMLGLVAVRPQFRPQLKTQRLPLHLLRNIVHYGAQYSWALALTLLPFATVFAIEFVTPAFVAVLAVFFLREHLTTSRIGAVILGLLGVVIILRPGIAAFNPAVLLVLAATVGFAIVMTTTKMLTRTDSTVTIIFWMSVIQLPIGLAGSDLMFPLKLSAADIPAALGIGISGTASHYCLSNAFRSGDATLVVPIDFLRVPLIALVGFFFFGEALDVWVFIGALVILSGIVWNLRSEGKRQQVAVPVE